jgi:hypothetical protein
MPPRDETEPVLWLCPICSLVAEDDAGPPVCRHGVGVLLGPAPARMRSLPMWHPRHPQAALPHAEP